MSIVKVANVHFETTGTNRIDYLNDAIIRITPASAASITSGNLLIGRTVDSTVGSGVKLDVAGSVNTSSLLLTSNVAFDTISSAVIKSPSANVISVSTSQSERARFDATGNLLIGRTDSTVGSGVKLDVTGGINAASVLVNGGGIPVSGGGTGLTSATAYAVVTGGTTSTGAFQSVSGVGTTSQFLSSSGAGAMPTWRDRISSNTTVSASGTAVDFGGIPSWVKRITVILNGISTTGTDSMVVQLGTSGGIVTSGYTSSSGSCVQTNIVGVQSRTTGFFIFASDGTTTISGHMTIINTGSNIWVASHVVKRGTPAVQHGAGDVNLGGTLTSVRILNDSGGSYDAGTFSLIYE